MNRWIGIVALLSGLSGCGGDEPGTGGATAVPEVSANAEVQAAFERCVAESRRELAQNNTHTSAEIMEMLYTGVSETCESAVAVTCAQDPEGPACRVMLDVYGT